MFPFVHIGPYAFATYGIMMATGMFTGYYVLRADLQRRGLTLQPLSLIVAICGTGFVASRLYRVAEFPGYYWQHPAQILSPSGYAFYGGVIGAVGVVVWLARVYRVSPLRLFDAVSPAAALGYGFGRVGCLLAGDGDYGTTTNLPWGMTFPHGLVPTLQHVHPTPIYEAFGAALIALYLWRIGAPARRPVAPAGRVFAEYLIWTGLARLLVEFIRLNPRVLWGLSNAQLVAIGSMLAGALLLVLTARRSIPIDAPSINSGLAAAGARMRTLGLRVVAARSSYLGAVGTVAVYCLFAATAGLFVYGCGTPNASASRDCTTDPGGCFTVGGTVSGLTTAMSLTLRDTSSNISQGLSGAPDDEMLTIAGPTPDQPTPYSFHFAIPLAPNSTYQVTVVPPDGAAMTKPEDCIITQGGGQQTITANVTNIAVICGYTIGGKLTGVPVAAGLVLQNNNGDSLSVPTSPSPATSFTFATPVASGGYAVTVLSQPKGQTCTVQPGTGSGVIDNANVTSVVVDCETNTAPTFTISAQITGLTAAGLVLQDNGIDNLSVPAPTSGSTTTATFATPLKQGAGYRVTVLTQPTGLTCTVSDGIGTVGTTNVTSVTVACSANPPPTYTIGGSISGLAVAGLVLLDNGGDAYHVNSPFDSFVFATALQSNMPYAVTVMTQPTGLQCTVSNGSGTVGSMNVTNVAVNCTSLVPPSASPILATVTNVAASGSNGYNSSISLYNIANPLQPAAIGASLSAQNVQGIAIDAANNIYYVTNNTSSSFSGTATYYACPAPAAGGAYVCSAKGTLVGGAWLALDASGNAYATSIGVGTSTVVKFSAAAGPGTTPTVVYRASIVTASFLGLAVTSDGSTLYVAESNNGSPGGGLDGLSIHVCAGPCAADGTDITQTLVSAVGSGGLTGSLAIGPGNKLYVGLANEFGSTTAPPSVPVLAICTPGAANSFACDTGTQVFPQVQGDINPFNYAVGVASDAHGNAYVAAALNAYGPNTSPPLGPVFMGFQPPPATGTALTAFVCTTLQSNGVPSCPINGLPAPGVVGYEVPPYSMAVTQP